MVLKRKSEAGGSLQRMAQYNAGLADYFGREDTAASHTLSARVYYSEDSQEPQVYRLTEYIQYGRPGMKLKTRTAILNNQYGDVEFMEW